MSFDDEFFLGDYRVMTFTSARWHQNSYLVHHLPSSDLLLIDPGGEEERIIGTAEELGGGLRLVLLTHAHPDHVKGVNEICRHFNLPFYIHPSDIKLLKRVPLYTMSMERRRVEAPENHRFLGSEDLRWHGDSIDFLHLPGHTQGGVCYYWKGVAFTGDTILHQQVGRTDLPGASIEVLHQSVSRLVDFLTAETLLFPGHSQPWSVREARTWWKTNSEAPSEFR